jgi:hypothetical protein
MEDQPLDWNRKAQLFLIYGMALALVGVTPLFSTASQLRDIIPGDSKTKTRKLKRGVREVHPSDSNE